MNVRNVAIYRLIMESDKVFAIVRTDEEADVVMAFQGILTDRIIERSGGRRLKLKLLKRRLSAARMFPEEDRDVRLLQSAMKD